MEVELTAKAPARLRAILSGYEQQIHAGALDGVIYVCDDPLVVRAVQRAADHAGLSDRVSGISRCRRSPRRLAPLPSAGIHFTTPTCRSTMSARNDAELDALMTAEEVARLLGVNVAWVYAKSRRRRIPTVTLGRYRRYRRSAIERWVVEIEDDPAALERPSAGRARR